MGRLEAVLWEGMAVLKSVIFDKHIAVLLHEERLLHCVFSQVSMRRLKCSWKKSQMLKMTATSRDNGISETLVSHASELGCPQEPCKALFIPL